MKHFYLSSTKGVSGICNYSRDFYNHVLKGRGYTFIDSQETISTILSAIGSRDHVHIELGIFQKKEIELLFIMLNAHYKHISVTLHDAPLVKYPFKEFKNTFLNNLSKFYDQFGNQFRAMKKYLEQIQSIYVLSKKGVESVKKLYGIDKVYYLPHIVASESPRTQQNNPDFIYFGFIGRNKGIEYSLQLHQELLREKPDSNFYVVGKPLGKEIVFYDYLKKKYCSNVHYLGYLPDETLDDTFSRAAIALMPFKDYRFFSPVSGSILYSLKKGKIVFTNEVNTIPEIIENGKTGFYLTGDLVYDTQTVMQVLDNRGLRENIKNESYRFLCCNHSADAVSRHFKD